MRVAVVGGTGFIGAAVLEALRSGGHDAEAFPAPRLSVDPAPVPELVARARRLGQELAPRLEGFDAVVNAAGVSDAVSSDARRVVGANSLLPGVLAVAADLAGCHRFLHVSSAAVQGRTPRLDTTTDYAPTSLYGRSKVLGEQVLLALATPACVIHRPTSVHGPGRSVTRVLTRVAGSPFSSVAAPGRRSTPQVHVQQVALAVSFLVEAQAPPRITLQPSEGFTTASFLELLGSRRPRRLPSVVCGLVVRLSYLVARTATDRLWGQARRLELLWFGQEQERGWLDEQCPRLTTQHRAWQTSGTSRA